MDCVTSTHIPIVSCSATEISYNIDIAGIMLFSILPREKITYAVIYASVKENIYTKSATTRLFYAMSSLTTSCLWHKPYNFLLNARFKSKSDAV